MRITLIFCQQKFYSKNWRKFLNSFIKNFWFQLEWNNKNFFFLFINDHIANKASMSKNNMEDNLYSKWTKARAGQTDENHFLWEIDSISRWTFHCMCVCWCVWLCAYGKPAYDSIWCCELVFGTAIFNGYACVCDSVEYRSVSFTFQSISYSTVSVQYLLNRSCSYTRTRKHTHKNCFVHERKKKLPKDADTNLMWKGKKEKKKIEENEMKRYTKREMCALITQRNEMKLQTFNLSVRVWICTSNKQRSCVFFFFAFFYRALHVSKCFCSGESGLSVCVLPDCFQFSICRHESEKPYKFFSFLCC